MSKKVGRNDPCPCGSGKKFKQCCLSKPPETKKIKAVWLSEKKEAVVDSGPDLMQRTFGKVIASDEEFNSLGTNSNTCENTSSDKDQHNV